MLEDFNMKKKIALISLISISIFIAGCGNKQVTTQAANNTQAVNKTEPVSNNQNNIVGSNNTTSSTSSSSMSTVAPNYSNYSGTWVDENGLKDDDEYAVTAAIKVDKDGNIEGNVTHCKGVYIKGKIQDNKLTCYFDDDNCGNLGCTYKFDFEGNKIVLTIKYNTNGHSYWGISEGTYTLINKNTKVNRTLTNLEVGGLQVIQDQCFPINLKNYGAVKFVSGFKKYLWGDVDAYFYLIDGKNNVLYKFPNFYGNSQGMLFSDIRAVSFVDVNKDGLKDIIIIADYKNYRSSSSSTSIPVCSIYFQKGANFENNKNLDDKINSSSNNTDIPKVLNYVNANLTK
jgi:hypothetical protein